MKLTKEVKTAVIAILILVSSIWGYHFLKGKNILSPTDEYYVSYDRIDGIIESGAVYYQGYAIGNINEIDFDIKNPKKFTLKFVVKKDFSIPKGSEVMAKETNLIAGAKDLQLIFSDSKEFHKPGDTLLAAYDPGMLGILEPIQGQLESVVGNLNTTLESLNNTLNPKMQEDLHGTIAAMRGSMQELQFTMSSRGELGKTLANVETLTNELAKNGEALGSTINNLSNITSDIDSADLDQTLYKLDSTLASVNSIMAKINNGEGTAGLIINDSALYMNLTAASASLDSLLSDLEENPGRYVHLSVFGGKNKDN